MSGELILECMHFSWVEVISLLLSLLASLQMPKAGSGFW